ncbi:MAG: hypothetical protein IPK69_10675 [Phycisphaerales bacterium]|nr:MAG: hypothetical protein IPK69_10675 [Phycisphaerales bacterium]
MRPRSILGPGVACTLVLLAPSAQSQRVPRDEGCSEPSPRAEGTWH